MTTPAEARLEVATRELVAAVLAVAAERSADAARPAPVELLDVKRAAERLGGMSRSTLYSLMAAGTVQSVTVGGRRLIPSSEVERLATAPAPAGRRHPSKAAPHAAA